MKVYRSSGGDVYAVETVVRYTVIYRDLSIAETLVEKETTLEGFEDVKNCYGLQELSTK